MVLITQKLAFVEQEICGEGLGQAEIGLPSGQNKPAGANLGAHRWHPTQALNHAKRPPAPRSQNWHDPKRLWLLEHKNGVVIGRL
jgi:hypothetical protein